MSSPIHGFGILYHLQNGITPEVLEFHIAHTRDNNPTRGKALQALHPLPSKELADSDEKPCFLPEGPVTQRSSMY